MNRFRHGIASRSTDRSTDLSTIRQSAIAVLASVALQGGVGCSSGTERRGNGTDGITGDAQASTGVAVIELGEGSYARAFDAARSALMSYRFSIDRVDAARGVITTHPKRTAGLASPWDSEQSGLGQEWEDLFNEQRRVVRVEFDLDEGEATRMRVSVELLRTHRPNWRVESESVRLSTHARSRDASGRVVPASFTERVGLDARFAQRLALSIEEATTRDKDHSVENSD